MTHFCYFVYLNFMIYYILFYILLCELSVVNLKVLKMKSNLQEIPKLFTGINLVMKYVYLCSIIVVQ